MSKKKPTPRSNKKTNPHGVKNPGIGKGQGSKVGSGNIDPLTQDNRRRQVLSLRMCWPPKSTREIADALHCSPQTVMNDLKYLRTQFSSEYFAEENHAAVARAMAELETVAFKALSDAETIRPRFVEDRAGLYRVALQALEARNSIMAEAGIIIKVPQKFEFTGKDGKPISYDVTTSSIEDRIAFLNQMAGKPAVDASNTRKSTSETDAKA